VVVVADKTETVSVAGVENEESDAIQPPHVVDEVETEKEMTRSFE